MLERCVVNDYNIAINYYKYLIFIRIFVFKSIWLCVKYEHMLDLKFDMIRNVEYTTAKINNNVTGNALRGTHMATTIAQRRKGDRDRQRKWREKQKARGRSPLTIMVTDDIRMMLDKMKRNSGETYSTIVERALRAMVPRGQEAPLKKPSEATLESIAATLIELGSQMQSLPTGEGVEEELSQAPKAHTRIKPAKGSPRADRWLKQEIERNR